MANDQQFDGVSPVSGYTLVQDKRTGHSYYVKGENLPDAELMTKIQSVQGPGRGGQIPSSGTPSKTPTDIALWQKANTPIITADVLTKLFPGMALGQKILDSAENHFIDKGDESLARAASFLSGSSKDAASMLSQFTSPVSAALLLASGGETALGDSLPLLRSALRAIQVGSGLGFGAQGASQAIKKRQAGESAADYTQRVLQGLGQAALGVSGTASGSREAAKSGLRRYTGAGEGPLKGAEDIHSQKQAEAQAVYQEKKAEISDRNRMAIAQAHQKADEDFDKIQSENERMQKQHEQTVQKIREFNETSKKAVRSGADAEQGAIHLANTVSESLPKIADEEMAKAKAAYPKIQGEVPAVDIYAELKTIVDDKLKGSGSVPSSLAKVLDDMAPREERGVTGFGRSTGPSVGGRHFNLNDPNDLKAYQRMKASGAFTPSEVSAMEGTGTSSKMATFDDLHGMYSELGRELYRGDLPGDSRAALSAARSYLLQRMTDLAKASGNLDQFNKAQRGWRVFENVFRNDSPTAHGGSPIARALNARDPITGNLRPAYVRAILMDDKAYGVTHELLGHYAEDTKELRNSLGLLKQMDRIARTSPKAAKLKAEPPSPSSKAFPKSAAISLRGFPEPPTSEPFDPVRWREQQMQKYALQSQHLRPYNFMPWRLPFTVIDQILSQILQNPDIRKTIAGGRE